MSKRKQAERTIDEDTERVIAVFLYAKFGFDNERIYDELVASTEFEEGRRDEPTETMKELQRDRCFATKYLAERGIDPNDYVTLYDKAFPKWAKDCKDRFYFVLKKGVRKADVLEEGKVKMAYLAPESNAVEANPSSPLPKDDNKA